MESMDHSVSGEPFTIVECLNCNFRYTNPVPEENEIGKYYKSVDYVSHSSSKKGIINRLYHVVRWYSLRSKVKLVKGLVKGRDLLDIGSGTGHFLKVAKESGWNVVGLEPDSDARNLAQVQNGVELQPIENLHAMSGQKFDVITLWHVLEHVYHLKRDLEKITTLLKPDGAIVIAVPNCASFDADYYKEFWAAYDLPIHLYHFRRRNIEVIAAEFGFELAEIKPMIFDSFYVSMLSEKYKKGNILKGVLIGLKSNWRAHEDSYSSQIYILRRKID